jgi:hypothetical protein
VRQFGIRAHRLGADLADLRFERRAAALRYDRCAELAAKLATGEELLLRWRQARCLLDAGLESGDLKPVESAIALARTTIAEIARRSGDRDQLIAANSILGEALLVRWQLSGDPEAALEATQAFRGALRADRLVALDGPAKGTIDEHAWTAGPDLDLEQCWTACKLADVFLQLLTANALWLLDKAEALTERVIARSKEQDWPFPLAWSQLLTARICFERHRLGLAPAQLESLLHKVEEAREILRVERFPLLWIESWAFEGEIRLEHAEATRKLDDIERARSAFATAQAQLTPQDTSLWIKVNGNLGSLFLRGTGYGETYIAVSAGLAYLRLALSVVTRGRDPLNWTRLHRAFGDGLVMAFDCGAHPDTLEAAVTAYQTAQEADAQSADASRWILTQFTMADLLLHRAEWTGDGATLGKAAQLVMEGRAAALAGTDARLISIADAFLERLSKPVDTSDPVPTPDPNAEVKRSWLATMLKPLRRK